MADALSSSASTQNLTQRLAGNVTDDERQQWEDVKQKLQQEEVHDDKINNQAQKIEQMREQLAPQDETLVGDEMEVTNEIKAKDENKVTNEIKVTEPQSFFPHGCLFSGAVLERESDDENEGKEKNRKDEVGFIFSISCTVVFAIPRPLLFSS